MTIMKSEVQFNATVTIEFDTESYPHYFEANEARGGAIALATDLFSDYASLRGYPFLDDSFDLRDAYVDTPEEVK